MRNKIIAFMLPLAALALAMPAQAKLQKETTQVKGTILRQKEVNLPTGELRHKLVLVKAQDGRQIPVDLGPTDRLKETPINIGSSITASGNIHRVGDRPVLFAQKITVGNTSLKIQRQMSGMAQGSDMPGGTTGSAGKASGSVSGSAGTDGTAGSVGAGAGGTQAASQGKQNIVGRIVRLKNVSVEPMKSDATSRETTESTETGAATPSGSATKVSSASHKVALLRTSDGQQVIVDLGPANKLKKVKLKNGQRITVQARPVRIGDRLVLLADRVSAGGKSVKITQFKPMSAMRGQDESESGSEPSVPSEGTSPENLPSPTPGGDTSGDQGGTGGQGTEGSSPEGSNPGGSGPGGSGGDTGSM